MSQYSSTHHIITNDQHLAKSRISKHTDPPHKQNAKCQKKAMYVYGNTEDHSINYSCVKEVRFLIVYLHTSSSSTKKQWGDLGL